MISRIKISDINSLLDSIAIVSSSDLDTYTILKKIMDEIQKLLNVQAASIFLYNKINNVLELKVASNLSDEEIKRIKVPLGKGIVSECYIKKTPLIIKDVSKEKSFFNKIDDLTSIKTKSILAVPLFIQKDIVGVVEAINKNNQKHFTNDDINLAVEFTRLASITLEKAFAQEKIMEMQKFETELELAKAIQEQLIPKSGLSLDNYRFDGFYLPARYIGGDYYDFKHYSNNEIFFIVADITGKGAQASLIMASLRAYLYAMLEAKIPLLDIVLNMNKFFYFYSPEDKLATMIVGILNLETNKIKYINCGHESILWVNKFAEIKSLPSTGTVIGAFNSNDFEMKEIKLQKDDFLFLFTDGVIDAINKEQKRYDYTRLKKLLKKYSKNPEKILTELPKSLVKYSDNINLIDDVTFLTIHRIK